LGRNDPYLINIDTFRKYFGFTEKASKDKAERELQEHLNIWCENHKIFGIFKRKAPDVRLLTMKTHPFRRWDSSNYTPASHNVHTRVGICFGNKPLYICNSKLFSCHDHSYQTEVASCDYFDWKEEIPQVAKDRIYMDFRRPMDGKGNLNYYTDYYNAKVLYVPNSYCHTRVLIAASGSYQLIITSWNARR
jgi:hypothetical protein